MTPIEGMAQVLAQGLRETQGRFGDPKRFEIVVRRMLRFLAGQKLPEAASEAAYAACQMSDRWNIEDDRHFQTACDAAILALADLS